MLPAAVELIHAILSQTVVGTSAPAVITASDAPDVPGWLGIGAQLLGMIVALGVFLWRSGAKMKDSENKIDATAREMGASVGALQKSVDELSREGKARAEAINKIESEMLLVPRNLACQAMHRGVDQAIQSVKDTQAADSTKVTVIQHDMAVLQATMNEVRGDIKSLLKAVNRQPTLKPGHDE